MVLIPWEKYHKKPLAKSAPSIGPSITEEAQPLSEGLDNALILQAIPKMYRNKAATILSHLADSDLLHWNHRGEIVYREKRVPFSHITDLLRDTQHAYKNMDLAGMSEFYQALAELNIPEGLIGHLQCRQMMRKYKSQPNHHVTAKGGKTSYKTRRSHGSRQKTDILKKWIRL